MRRNRVLIEDWLPIADIGVECLRENSTGKHPAPNRLHVWWARRPLVASRAAVLASVLPSWSPEWPQSLLARFPTSAHYQDWFRHLLGIRGDPVAARRRVLRAKELGVKLKQAYDGPRAFTLSPETSDLDAIRELCSLLWSKTGPTVLDPMAGGGSIPLESLRFGLQTRVNELNPVAYSILALSLETIPHFGAAFAEDIRKWGRAWEKRVRERLSDSFPRQEGESIHAYLFARTVICPETGKRVPLSPNWWLRKGSDGFAVRPVAKGEECRYELLRAADLGGFDPARGTVSDGVGRSIWTGNAIHGDYIKSEAKAGRLGAQMYAIAHKTTSGSGFRLPTRLDLSALESAAEILTDRRRAWQAAGLLPTEAIGEESNYDRGHRLYGIGSWTDFFSPRQLLVLGVMAEELTALRAEIESSLAPRDARSLMTALVFVFDKALVHETMACRWDGSRRKVVSFFDKHNYEFKWSFAEFDGAHNLLPWAIEQVAGTYADLAGLIEPARSSFRACHGGNMTRPVNLTQGDAASLPDPPGSVDAVVVDPPYYDNVQYSELSDFFYVWQKRLMGGLHPGLYNTELTDKAQEAVANPARFARLDKRRKHELARADYERKMTRIFAESHRVLNNDGVLTVMFTHKEVEAWDTLGQSLIEAGFEIESSWPVRTEPEHSLHQAKKAAAASTILLTCRKRTEEREPAWWDDLQVEVRRVAREKAEEFLAAGIDGVDLYISTFGPTLSVISRQWPVYTSEVNAETGDPRPLRPEEALDLAREEVADLRRRGLLLGRDMAFDPITDWYLLAWDAFKAIEIPYDEARKLALALGLDLDGELVRLRVVSKKASSVILQEPRQRRRPGLADPEEASFARLLDAAQALMVAYGEDGIRGAESFLKRTRLGSDVRFQALVQALVNAIPRTKLRGKFVRPEAGALDGLAVLFPDLEFPAEPAVVLEPSQGALDFGGDSSGEGEDVAEDDEEDEDE